MNLRLSAIGAALCTATALLVAVPTTSSAASRYCAAPPLPPPGQPLVVDPVTTTAPSGPSRQVSPTTAARIRSGIRNFLTCINSGDHLRASTLLTPYFVTAFMGQESYQQVPDVLGGLTIERTKTGPVYQHADGSFTTDMSYLGYGHQLSRARLTWWLDPADGHLKLNRLTALSSPVAHGATPVQVEMGEYFFRLDPPVVVAPQGNAVLRLRNVGQAHHEAVLLQLPNGYTGADLFNGNLEPKDVRTIAQDNRGGELSLTGLAPGTYTLVDFIPAADGLPNGMHGQTLQFEVVRR